MASNMDIKAILKSQYLAALAMLEQAIRACPDALWHSPAFKNQFWHTAYHAIFYTHLYLHPRLEDFKPWERHQERYRSLHDTPGPEVEPIPRAETLAFLAFFREQLDGLVAGLDLEAPSGFHWLPFNKLELQFYNLRHLQQHVGELYERLGAHGGIETGWVGTVKEGEN